MSDSRPNVLWLMTDEQRTDALGCYGSRWAVTPHLDLLASQGALFRHAVTPAPVCVPARVSLVTGLSPSHTGVWYNHNHGREFPLLTEPFREAGYATACIGKQGYHTARPAFALEVPLVLSEHVHYFRYAPRYDEAAHGMVRYPAGPEPWILAGRFPASAEETAEAEAIRAAQSWLGSLASGSPFLLCLSLNGPHTPVVPPAPYDSLIPAEDLGLPAAAKDLPPGRPEWVGTDVVEAASADRLTPEQITAMRRAYYGEVAYLDALLGRLLVWMGAHGLLENTIIAFTSDHGTHLGDYGLVQKQTFYEPVVTVPLVFWYPRAIPAGSSYDTPVATLSLLPTLLELAGLPPPRCDGASLAGPLTQRTEPQTIPVFSEFSLGSYRVRSEDRLAMVRDGHWKASCCLDPGPRDVDLCDLAADPHERRNLHGDPSCAAIEARLLGLITDHVAG